MTAGFVAVPTIVPLKAFTAGERKNHVDTATKIELKSGVHMSLQSYRPIYMNLQLVLDLKICTC